MKLVIFDCDGVLINSEDIYVNSEIEFLSNAGVQFEKRAYMEAFMTVSWPWLPKSRPQQAGRGLDERPGHARGPAA